MRAPVITEVSDTALWVATYRAQESERPDALFRDPLAQRLIGERGEKIGAGLSRSKYSRWAVVTRTCIIDHIIRELVQDQVDTVVNLGAGLDTRPYRLEVPESLRWVEVDYPHLIRYKEDCLTGAQARCRLERIGLDLADPLARLELLARLGSQSKRALILTEGVTPYLSNDEVAGLASDLRRQESFRFWIVDHHPPTVRRQMTSPNRMRELANAPVRFAPNDWVAFFLERGWVARERRYLGEESQRLGRPIPMPWWARLLQLLPGSSYLKARLRLSAYVLLVPKEIGASTP